MAPLAQTVIIDVSEMKRQAERFAASFVPAAGSLRVSKGSRYVEAGYALVRRVRLLPFSHQIRVKSANIFETNQTFRRVL